MTLSSSAAIVVNDSTGSRGPGRNIQCRQADPSRGGSRRPRLDGGAREGELRKEASEVLVPRDQCCYNRIDDMLRHQGSFTEDPQDGRRGFQGHEVEYIRGLNKEQQAVEDGSFTLSKERWWQGPTTLVCRLRSDVRKTLAHSLRSRSAAYNIQEWSAADKQVEEEDESHRERVRGPF